MRKVRTSRREKLVEGVPPLASSTTAATPTALPLLNPRLALLAILCVAAFLRLYQITTIPPGLFPDEAMNGSNILENLETHSLSVFYAENGGREGFYIAVATPFVAYLGNTAWALRLPAALIGILTVLGVYFLGMELLGEATGLLAAFFLATSFWHVNFSRIAFRAIAAPLFLTWSLFLLLVALRRLRDARPYWAAMWAAAALYGLGFYTYIAYRATPLLIAAVLLHSWSKARRQGWTVRLYRGVGIFLGVLAAVVAPLCLYFAWNPGSFFGRTSQLSIMTNREPVKILLRNIWLTGRMFFADGDRNWRHNIENRAELYWPVAILFALGVLVALRQCRRNDGDDRLKWALPLGWLVLSAIPAVFSDDGMPPHALRSILMIPAVFLLTAAGAWAAYEALLTRISPGILRAAALMSLALLSIEVYDSYFNTWARDPRVAQAFTAWSREVADSINKLPREVPKYVIVASPGVLINSIPLAAQTVMYLTRSYTPTQQKERNIHYIAMPARTVAEAISSCQQESSRVAPSAAFCI